MLKSVTSLNEHSRLPYTDKLSNSCLDLIIAEQWIFNSMLANFNPNHPDEEICVSIRNIAILMNKRLDNVRRQIARSCMSLPAKALFKINIESSKKRKDELVPFEQVPLFSLLRFDSDIDVVIGKFNPEILPAIIPASQSPIYKLTMTFAFSIQYTMRLFSLLISRYLSTGDSDIYLSVTELMTIVVSPKVQKGNKSLFRVSNFNQMVLERVIKEINEKTHIKVTYEEVLGKSEASSRGRRKTIGYQFHIEEHPGQSIETYSDKQNLEQELLRRGFTKSLAEKVITEKSWNTIRRNMYYFDATVKKSGKNADQLGKILYSCIEKDEEKKNRKSMTYVPKAQVVNAMPLLFELDSPEIEEANSNFLEEVKRAFPNSKLLKEVLDERQEN